MIDDMVIADNAIKYILFQRTTYLRCWFPVTFLYRLLNKFLPFPTPIYNLVVEFESRFGISRIKALYRDDMKHEYHSIRSFLPKACDAVLDIGCGVAGIDVFINSHYPNQSVNFYLLDKSHVEKNVFYMFNPKGAFYNSLDVARAMLTDNGISDQFVHLIEANDNNDIKVGTKVDLVISLISWGFHYPVETYVERVHELLSEDGVVILDIRKGTDGIDVIRHKFKQIELVFEAKKQYRVAVRK